jgi:hypothetical protein
MLNDQETGSGVFIAAEVDGVGNSGSGDTTRVFVETHLEAFVNNFWIWVYFCQLSKYQDFQSVSFHFQGLLLCLVF